jgi:predicted sulfurtransferase
MAFVRLPNVKGKVFVPDAVIETQKKHACRDCYSCQMCSESKCHLCQSESGKQTLSNHRRRCLNRQTVDQKNKIVGRKSILKNYSKA